jgi:spermidine synthase
MGMLRNAPRRIGRFVTGKWGHDDEDFPVVDVSEQDGVRSLHLGSATIQSSMRVAAPYELELTYTRGMMAFLLFARTAKTVLLVGLGGGSIPKFIHRYLPELHITTVELNPDVITAARAQFLLPENDERLNVVEGDGAAYIQAHPARHDVLMLDAYDSTGLAPALSSQEFYDNCRRALTMDGILVVNLWGSDKHFDVYLQRIEQSFESRVLCLPTGRPGNIVVFAFKRYTGDLRIASLRERAKKLEAGIESQRRIEFVEFVERLQDYNLHSSNRLML